MKIVETTFEPSPDFLSICSANRRFFQRECAVYIACAIDIPPQIAHASPLAQVGTQVYLLDKRNLDGDSLGLTLDVYLQLKVRLCRVASVGDFRVAIRQPSALFHKLCGGLDVPNTAPGLNTTAESFREYI